MQAPTMGGVLLLALFSATAQARVATAPEGSEYKIVTIELPIDETPMHMFVCKE